MNVAALRGELPGGGGNHRVEDYVSFIAAEYLRTFVAHGGTAVKLVVPGDDRIAEEFSAGLAEVADGFIHVRIDAADTKVHLMDRLFAALARQIDWSSLAANVLHNAYERAGFPAMDIGVAEPTVAAVAAHHEVDAAELYRSVRRALEGLILADHNLAYEFRVAMLRLCQALMAHGDVSEADRAAVLGWLCCEKIPAAQLRSLLLQTRITRHNARSMLTSLTRWVRGAGRTGMVMELDLSRVAIGRRPAVEERNGFYYSKAAALDAYELLRQLIDATDELVGLFVAVLVPPELVTDEVRGLPTYNALQLRVADEVRDRNRANPYAALVRLDVRLEAVR